MCGGGEFTITEECHFCSDHELEAYDECKHTQYVEKLKCKSGDIKWKRWVNECSVVLWESIRVCMKSTFRNVEKGEWLEFMCGLKS